MADGGGGCHQSGIARATNTHVYEYTPAPPRVCCLPSQHPVPSCTSNTHIHNCSPPTPSLLPSLPPPTGARRSSVGRNREDSGGMACEGGSYCASW